MSRAWEAGRGLSLAGARMGEDMKVITPAEMAAIDEAAIREHGIEGAALMEAAGSAVTRVARSMLKESGGRTVAIWCGKGNNGGDGFVAARLLSKYGIAPTIFFLSEPSEITGDAAMNLRRIEKMLLPIVQLHEGDESRSEEAGEEAISDLRSGRFSLHIDAIFGTGFAGEATGLHAEAIEAINSAGGPVLSVDIPSGVCGATGFVSGPAVVANRTVTFGAVKTGLVQYPGAAHAGEIEVAEIGLPGVLLDTVPESRMALFTAEDAFPLLPVRGADVHKRDCGAVLVVGGSTGMSGAPALAAIAALRSGAGLVSVGVPASLGTIMEIKLTETITCPLADTPEGGLAKAAGQQVLELCESHDVLVIGPGISTAPEVVRSVEQIISRSTVPLVIDADALNALALAKKTSLMLKRKAPAVITPHPGEMARLLETDSASVQRDRVGAAKEAASKWGVVVLLKGAGTVIVEPGGEVRIINSGNPGMATAGMGDVLAGCIGALLAQGLTPFDAASTAAFFHGRAGDLVAGSKGEAGLIATDVAEMIGPVLGGHKYDKDMN